MLMETAVELISSRSPACHLTHYEYLIHQSGKVVGCAPAESRPNTLARAASIWFGFAELSWERAGGIFHWQTGEGVRREEGRLKPGHKGEENHR